VSRRKSGYSGYFSGIMWLIRGIWKFIRGVGLGLYTVAKYLVQGIDSILQEDKRW
jgi:hypothetical protein